MGDRAARGLQRERTLLAWNRTAVAMLAVGLLLGDAARRSGLLVAWVPAVLAVGTGVWVSWVTTARPGGLERSDERNRLRRKRTATVATVATVLGCASLLLTLREVVAG